MATSFLPNWSLHFHKRSNDGSGKCNILAGSGGIHVAVFDISAEDKLALDRIEGLGRGYSETLLSIPDIGDCVTYVAQDSHIDGSLVPYDWYKELVMMGARVHGFPDDYLSRISSMQAIDDPDPDRRVNRWETVALVKAEV
jgi:hypothetical protein